MFKEGSLWHCIDCGFKSPKKDHVYEHIEAKHIIHGGYNCPYCETVLKTRASLRMHQRNKHQ